MNRKEVNRMLTKREQIMNMGLSKDSSFIIKREYISKKSVIDFKESDNEILRKNNTEEIENGRTIQRKSERQSKEKQKDEIKRFKTGQRFRELRQEFQSPRSLS